jgi:hypothetical protein
MAVTIAAAIVLPVAAVVLVRSVRFPLAMMWSALRRPVVAVIVMVFVLKLLPLSDLPAFMRLLAHISLGAAVYLCALAVLWYAAGQPEGPESAVWRAMRGIRVQRAG